MGEARAPARLARPLTPSPFSLSHTHKISTLRGLAPRTPRDGVLWVEHLSWEPRAFLCVVLGGGGRGKRRAAALYSSLHPIHPSSISHHIIHLPFSSIATTTSSPPTRPPT